MKLSVIIVNYNVKYFLEQCLYSIRKAKPDFAMEVMVVDNNSVDGSVEMLKEKFPEVILIENKVNTGFSKANNLAIRQSKAEYILLLNPDTVVQEDTFTKVVSFMDTHPDAGGLGVKMIDGKGNFLPESKRGLPTPLVAFFKIFGLSKLFPRSRVFGRYHLGYLDREKNHEVDVLSGAFMLLRKTALDKAGLLDETFFMYGEDIDLSYRIQLAGFKNYYFSETSIIHYKGESTKKSSVNYVFVFYNAMIIFAKKHFSKNNANLFAILIYWAIYLRAGFALLIRLIRRLALPVMDVLMIYGGIYLLKIYWENHHKYVRQPYADTFMEVMVPAYILFWLLAVFLSGGYDKPLKLSKIVRGLFWGTLSIAAVYGFLNEHWRFSRALIILGAFWALISMLSLRLILQALNPRKFGLEDNTQDKRVIIIAEEREGKRILQLITQINPQINFIGFVHPQSTFKNLYGEFIGNISQLSEIIEVYQVREVIFSNGLLSLQDIISWMAKVNQASVDFKIAPEESLFIIGSNSVDNPGDLYTMDFNFAISSASNRRNKRLFDFFSSLMLLLVLPIIIFIFQRKRNFVLNLFSVLFGYKTWVSYTHMNNQTKSLPALKPGILSPFDHFDSGSMDNHIAQRLNTLYAKHYRLNNDIRIVLHSWKFMDRNVSK